MAHNKLPDPGEGYTYAVCEYCHGSGRIKQPNDRKGRTMPCPICKGTGRSKRKKKD